MLRRMFDNQFARQHRRASSQTGTNCAGSRGSQLSGRGAISDIESKPHRCSFVLLPRRKQTARAAPPARSTRTRALENPAQSQTAKTKMAEARAAANKIHRIIGSFPSVEAIVQRAKIRGPQAHTIDGSIVLVVPSPRDLVRLGWQRLFHLYHHFERAVWPAPVWAVILTLTACVGHVILSQQDSWLRSGAVASGLWAADERFLVGFLPAQDDPIANLLMRLQHRVHSACQNFSRSTCALRTCRATARCFAC